MNKFEVGDIITSDINKNLYIIVSYYNSFYDVMNLNDDSSFILKNISKSIEDVYFIYTNILRK